MGIVIDLTKGIYRRIYDRAIRGDRINRVSVRSEFWFWRLHMIADDFGNFEADPTLCRVAAAPLRKALKDHHVAEWLNELATVPDGCQYPLIRFYDHDGNRYGHIVGFTLAQPAGKNGKRVRRFPACPDPYDQSFGCIQVNPGESNEKSGDDQETNEAPSKTPMNSHNGGIQVNPGESGCAQAEGGPGHTDSDSDSDSDTDSDSDSHNHKSESIESARARGGTSIGIGSTGNQQTAWPQQVFIAWLERLGLLKETSIKGPQVAPWGKFARRLESHHERDRFSRELLDHAGDIARKYGDPLVRVKCFQTRVNEIADLAGIRRQKRN